MSDEQYVYKRQIVKLDSFEWVKMRNGLDGDGYKPPPGWRIVSFSFDPSYDYLTLILEGRVPSPSPYR